MKKESDLNTSSKASSSKKAKVDITATLDTLVNTEIACEHSKLKARTTKNDFTLVSSDVWNLIKGVFPDAIALIEGCSICEEIFTTRAQEKSLHSEDLEKYPTLRKILVRTNAIFPPELGKPEVVQDPTNLIPKDRRFALIDGEWLGNWRRYVNDFEVPKPEPLLNITLRCSCEMKGTLISNNLRSISEGVCPSNATSLYGDGLPRSEIISMDQFDAFKALYSHTDSCSSNTDSKECGGSHDLFQVELYEIGGVWAWQPPCCMDCSKELQRKSQEERSTFNDMDVKIVVLSPGTSVPTEFEIDDPNIDCEVEDVQQRHRRRSSRKSGRRTETSFAITTSSSDTVALLKLKICQALDDAVPNCQTLFRKGGVELCQNFKELSEYGVTAGESLYLKIADSSKDVDTTDFSHLENGQRQIETGFTGTFLSSSGPKQSSATNKGLGAVDLTQEISNK